MTPLPAVRLAGEYAGAGDSRARSVAVHGEDDVATREYRHGDDLRRVHWRSTARVGELMVRREEQPWESRATVMLDTRGRRPPRRGPDRELRVGGVGRRQHRRAPAPRPDTRCGWSPAPGIDVDANESTATGSCSTTLAECELAAHGDSRVLVEQVRRRADGGLVIGLFGLLTPAEAELLQRRCGAHGATCVGLR